MMPFKLSCSVLLTSLLFSGFVSAADLGKLTESCNACHGKDGASTEADMPSIGGMSAKYLELTFKAYKGKERLCAEASIKSGPQKDTKTDMCKIATALSDAEVKDLVKFYSGKKFGKSSQIFDPALAEAGKAVHKKSCEKCHSEGGSVASDDAGILAGQKMAYLEATFKEQREEKRPVEKKMKLKYDDLKDEDFKALVHYYGSLK
jgi:sulfide dehydrogenase cytochrome subunit